MNNNPEPPSDSSGTGDPLRPENQIDPEKLASWSSLFYAIIGGIALGTAISLDLPLVPEPVSIMVPIWLAAGLAAGYIGHLLTLLLHNKRSPFSEYMESMAEAFSDITGKLDSHVIFQISLFSGISEELAFRGLLQGWLSNLIGPVPAIFGAAMAFGVMHAPMEPRLKYWPFMAAGAGLALGFLRYVEGGVIACSAAHFTLNFLNFQMMQKKLQEQGSQKTPQNTANL